MRHPGAALARCAAVVLGLFLWLGGAGTAAALTQQQALAMAAGDSDARIAALNNAVAAADPALAAYVRALLDDEVKVAGGRAYIVRDGKATDAASGAEAALPEGAEDVLNNNRMRRELGAAAAAMQLLSPDRDERARGIAELRSQADESKLPLIDKAAAVETDAALKEQLELLRAAVRHLVAPTRRAGSTPRSCWPAAACRPRAHCCWNARRRGVRRRSQGGHRRVAGTRSNAACSGANGWACSSPAPAWARS